MPADSRPVTGKVTNLNEISLLFMCVGLKNYCPFYSKNTYHERKMERNTDQCTELPV